jgi:predicted outer membrane protein
MDPTQPQQPLPSDYLNQIAPQAPKRKMVLTKKQLVVVGGLVGAILLVIVLAIVVGLSSNKNPLQQLAARLQSTQTIAASASTLINNSQLSALNSNLTIYLANTNRDIAVILLKENIDVKKLDGSIVTSESGTDVTARLNDARLNAVYDSTYAREMAYRLNTIVALMSQIDESTHNKDLKTFLDSALINLKPTQQAFSNFSAVTE